MSAHDALGFRSSEEEIAGRDEEAEVPFGRKSEGEHQVSGGTTRLRGWTDRGGRRIHCGDS